MDGPNYVRDGGEELGVVLEAAGSYAVWKQVEAPDTGGSWKRFKLAKNYVKN
jgi:hypothetical protein